MARTDCHPDVPRDKLNPMTVKPPPPKAILNMRVKPKDRERCKLTTVTAKLPPMPSMN